MTLLGFVASTWQYYTLMLVAPPTVLNLQHWGPLVADPDCSLWVHYHLHSLIQTQHNSLSGLRNAVTFFMNKRLGGRKYPFFWNVWRKSLGVNGLIHYLVDPKPETKNTTAPPNPLTIKMELRQTSLSGYFS